jgi:hypothetical protein
LRLGTSTDEEVHRLIGGEDAPEGADSRIERPDPEEAA